MLTYDETIIVSFLFVIPYHSTRYNLQSWEDLYQIPQELINDLLYYARQLFNV
jgi:hypothetical protein